LACHRASWEPRVPMRMGVLTQEGYARWLWDGGRGRLQADAGVIGCFTFHLAISRFI
jgi:hypothetical protein